MLGLHYGFRYTVNSGTESTHSRLNGSKNQESPSIRVKARYQTVEILPLNVYDSLLDFIKLNYLSLCMALEPILSVKAKVSWDFFEIGYSEFEILAHFPRIMFFLEFFY